MIMMSMFSSFDALCIESYGQKLRLSMPTSKAGKEAVDLDRKPSTDKVVTKESKSPTPPAQVRRRQHIEPRFAVELDGLHCFESIVPY